MEYWNAEQIASRMEDRGSRSSIVHLLSSTRPAVALRVERLPAVDDQRVSGDEGRFVGN